MIGAIVLAAGASSRMGRPKALLRVRGNGPTFLEAIELTLKAAGVSELRLVVSPELERRGPDVVVNPTPADGMLSSVLCGLRALSPDLTGAFLWPVDHPMVATATITAMLEALRADDAPVVVPTYQGKRGHPVLFASRLFPELLAADPRYGARAVVHDHTDRVELPVEDPGVTQDVNTPSDYECAVGAPPEDERP